MGKKILNDKTRLELNKTFVKLSNGYTNYELLGNKDAETIVLVHGNAAPLLSWDNNVDSLVEAGFQVLRYDIFGHGYSDRPNLKEYNRDLYIRQLEELVTKLEINTPFIIAGTSQGGAIAAEYAATYPEKVKKIALLGPMFDDFAGKDKMKTIRGPFGKLLFSIASDKSLSNPEKNLTTKKFNEELQNKILKGFEFEGRKRAMLANLKGNAFDDLGFWNKLAETKIPALITLGEHDLRIPRDSMDRLHKLLEGSRYEIIKDAGHLAHYEFSEVLNPILIDFFK